jgi:hypothetical protein
VPSLTRTGWRSSNSAPGHLVHVPSHIYFRLDRYRDALEMNEAAVAANEANLARVQAEGIYPGGFTCCSPWSSKEYGSLSLTSS